MNDKLQDILFPGETVLWEGKPQKACFVLRRFGKLLLPALAFLLFDGFFIFSVISSGDIGAMWPFLAVFFAFHLLPVWLCVGKLVSSSLEHKNIVYAVTSRRIIVRSGIIGLDFKAIDYVDISNVHVDVSVLERIFKVGSIVILTSSGEALCLFSIKDPYSLYTKINKIFIDIKADVHYPNAYRPEDNPGYNTKYTGNN